MMSEVSAVRSGDGLEFNTLLRAVVAFAGGESSWDVNRLTSGLRLWMGFGILIEALAFGVVRFVDDGVVGEGARRDELEDDAEDDGLDRGGAGAALEAETEGAGEAVPIAPRLRVEALKENVIIMHAMWRVSTEE